MTYTTPKSFIPHPPGCSMLVTKRYLNEVINDYSDSWAQDEFFGEWLQSIMFVRYYIIQIYNIECPEQMLLVYNLKQLMNV